MELPSPTLLIGEYSLCRNAIGTAKKKYSNYQWIEISVEEDLDKLIESATTDDIFNNPKIIVIRDIPNQKAVRESIFDIVKIDDKMIRFILWDTNNFIKPDPKTNCFSKTWEDYIEKLKTINGFKIINAGFNFTEKEEEKSIQYVIDLFSKNKKIIDYNSAKIFISILGKSKASIKLEIEKFCLAFQEENIDLSKVLQFTFPANKEVILYHFNDCLDKSYEESIIYMNILLEIGINPNILIEIMMKKVRWQLAIAYMYTSKIPLSEISSRLILMGKFPSSIWTDKDKSYSLKKKESEKYEEPEDKVEFIVSQGLPRWHIKEDIEKVRTEAIPMDFMANQLVNVYNENYISKLSEDQLVEKALENYSFISNALKEIRYGEDPVGKLYSCIYKLTECQSY
jgi:DNA polymerase III delta subunit